jgi:hypothetical protein
MQPRRSWSHCLQYFAGQGVYREVESEGHAEKYRAVIDGETRDVPVSQRWGKVESELWRRRHSHSPTAPRCLRAARYGRTARDLKRTGKVSGWRYVSANRHSVLSYRRSPTRPTTALHSCAWLEFSQHFLPACAALRKRFVVERQKIVRLLVEEVLIGEDTIIIRSSISIRFPQLRPKTGAPRVGLVMNRLGLTLHPAKMRLVD